MTDYAAIKHGDICDSAIGAFMQLNGSITTFPGLLKKIIRLKAWENRIAFNQTIRLKNLRELICEDPIRGWGEDPKKIEAVLRDDAEALAMFRQAMKHQGERVDLGNNVPQVERPDRGNARAYSVAVVQRECDAATVAAVLKGDVSPHRALVKAGLREVRQVYLPRDPAKAAAKLLQSFDAKFALELAKALMRQAKGRNG